MTSTMGLFADHHHPPGSLTTGGISHRKKKSFVLRHRRMRNPIAGPWKWDSATNVFQLVYFYRDTHGRLFKHSYVRAIAWTIVLRCLFFMLNSDLRIRQHMTSVCNSRLCRTSWTTGICKLAMAWPTLAEKSTPTALCVSYASVS